MRRACAQQLDLQFPDAAADLEHGLTASTQNLEEAPSGPVQSATPVLGGHPARELLVEDVRACRAATAASYATTLHLN